MRWELLLVLLLTGGLGCSSSDGSAGPNTAGSGSLAGGAGSSATAGSGGGVAQSGSGGSVTQAGSAGQGIAGSQPGQVGPVLSGRFDTSNEGAAVFAWSGASISLRFEAPSIMVTLSDGGNNRFQVLLDDQTQVLATKSGKNEYLLGSGLGAGPHRVTIHRRTEAFFGETTFHGFDVAESAWLASELPTRRLEVIGDSISAGYGNEGMNPCSFEAATENHWLSYEAIAARTLSAELFTEAWSGIGMLRNVDGSTTDTMPVRYPRTLPERAGSSWDFSRYAPDAVLINLGTNDFAMGDPGSAFQTSYTAFVTQLRGHYPNARLYLAVGSMLSGANYQKASGYLSGVIAARASAGDTNLALLELASQLEADGYGCDYHPSLATHQKMAGQLVATLKADLGW